MWWVAEMMPQQAIALELDIFGRGTPLPRTQCGYTRSQKLEEYVYVTFPPCNERWGRLQLRKDFGNRVCMRDIYYNLPRPLKHWWKRRPMSTGQRTDRGVCR